MGEPGLALLEPGRDLLVPGRDGDLPEPAADHPEAVRVLPEVPVFPDMCLPGELRDAGDLNDEDDVLDGGSPAVRGECSSADAAPAQDVIAAKNSLFRQIVAMRSQLAEHESSLASMSSDIASFRGRKVDRLRMQGQIDNTTRMRDDLKVQVETAYSKLPA